MSRIKSNEVESESPWIQRLINMPYHSGRILSTLILFLLYIFAAHQSYLFVFQPGTNAVFWLPSGVTVALFIKARSHPKIWPYWLLALLSGHYFVVSAHEAPLITTVFWSTANLLLPLLSAVWARTLGGSLDFRKLHDVFRWLGIVVLALLPSALCAGLGTLLWFKKTSYLLAVLSWFGSDFVGIVLVSPVILSFAVGASRSKGSLIEAFLLVLLMGLAFVGMVKYSELTFLNRSFFSFLILFVAWAALRFGPRGASISLLAFSMIEVYATIQGAGTFSNPDLPISDRLFTIQLLIANLGILMLVLAAAIEEQTVALRKAEAAIQTRDDFISIASHELKSPITSVSMELQMINRYLQKLDWESLPRERIVQLTESSVQQLLKLSRLVNDLLDVSRISIGKLILQLAPVNLSELVLEIAKQFTDSSEDQKVNIELRVEPKISGNLDRVRIEQVLTNLLSNAVKYGKGSPITVSLISVDGIARLIVSDKGPGISKHNLALIFNRFERIGAEKTTKGLGLGLYIVREIVEAHAGKIEVTSQEGKGCSFAVDLPLNETL